MAIRHLLASTRPGTRGRATALLAAASLAVAACGTTSQELADAPDVDTDDTATSDDVSEAAESADQTTPPEAEATALARVEFDGTPRTVAAVTCDEGPDITAQLEDGGDVRVASEDDGTVTVRIVVPDEGASQAWAAEDPGAEALTFLQDSAEGTVTVTPVDVDGAPDADREDAELTFDLPCDA